VTNARKQNNNMKIIKITLISLLTVLGTVGCMNHKNNEPYSFTAYTYQVTIDKDGTITYRKVKPNEE
jgi:hypothetical protein